MTEKVVLARRSDGLGERLNAILNAMRLADLLGVDFRFTWPADLVDHPMHAIPPAEELFDPAFLEHLVDHDETDTGYVMPHGRAPDLAALQDQLGATERGLLAPNRYLGTFLSSRAVPAVKAGYSGEFARIGFTPGIKAALAAAASIPLRDGAAGLHLRSGDIFVRSDLDWNRITPKIMPAPIARDLTERIRAEGRDVVLFGQDAGLIEHLCASTGALDGTALRPSADRPAAAMFDIALLSRCDPIIGGNSGFVRLAAIMADRSVTDFRREIAGLVDLTRRDLAEHHRDYSSRQAAFAWWAAYYFERDDLDLREAIDLVGRAVDTDPSIPHYRLRLSGLLYRDRQDTRADAVLRDALAADVASDGEMLRSVMAFSSSYVAPAGSSGGGIRQDHAEIIEDVEAAAERGSATAALYRAAQRGGRADRTGALADLARFREEVPSGTADRARLEALALATVEHRLANAETV